MSWSLFYISWLVKNYLKLSKMPFDRNGFTILISGAVGRSLAWDIWHNWLEMAWSILNDIRVAVETLNNVFLISCGPKVPLIWNTAAVSVTDGYHLVVSVTAGSDLVLVSRLSLASRCTENLIPLTSQVWVMIHTACRWDDSVSIRQFGPRLYYVTKVHTILGTRTWVFIHYKVKLVFWHILKLFQSFIIYLK